jgi:GAF domain-containing protein
LEVVARSPGTAPPERGSRDLLEQQAALRRVATVVARGAAPDELFAAVGREVAALLGADGARVVRYVDGEIDQLDGWCALEYGPLPMGRVGHVETSVTTAVFRTGRPARSDRSDTDAWDAPDEIRRLGIRSAVGAPIVVDGRLWGAVLAWLMHDARLPEAAEARLAGFTELVAVAIANSANRAELDRLLAEQAALRRVAMLVARGSPPDAVVAAVAREVCDVLGVDATHLGRFAPDGTVVSVAHAGDHVGVPIGARFPMDGDSISSHVLRTGRPGRIEDYAKARGIIAATVREIGICSSIGVPISVSGRLWGVMIATSKSSDAFPAETEARLEAFTELVGTALANASAQDHARRLSEEQAALRRVATLVAKETEQTAVFAAIAEEIGRLLGVDSIEMARYDDDAVAVVVAGWGRLTTAVPIGTRVPLGGRNATSLVFRTGRAARIDDYAASTGAIGARVTAEGVHAAVATPIFVEGRLWGAMIAAHLHDERLPPDTEARIAQFTELMGTAIANAEARAEVRRLAHEQSALRRVATLVARGAAPAAVFDAVTTEAADVLDASAVTLGRYDDDVIAVVAHGGREAGSFTAGQRLPLDGQGAATTVLRTGRATRLDDPDRATGSIADVAREIGVRATVAAPVVVDDRIWGVLIATWTDDRPPPDTTEERMARFAELLDTAIANADSRDQLTASRARVLAAGDEARKRVVQDLHDGAQQRLVHTIVTLKLAQRALGGGRGDLGALVGEALQHAQLATADLRELAHGILPSILTRGGLRAAVDSMVSRLDLPVDVDVDAASGRLPPDLEATAYFIVTEALTNLVKHSHATRAQVRADVADGVLVLAVRDDGVGGADPHGHGLVGLTDRVAALGGRLEITSPAGRGTVLTARLPLPA